LWHRLFSPLTRIEWAGGDVQSNTRATKPPQARGRPSKPSSIRGLAKLCAGGRSHPAFSTRGPGRQDSGHATVGGKRVGTKRLLRIGPSPQLSEGIGILTRPCFRGDGSSRRGGGGGAEDLPPPPVKTPTRYPLLLGRIHAGMGYFPSFYRLRRQAGAPYFLPRLKSQAFGMESLDDPEGGRSAPLLPLDCCLRALLQSHRVGLLVASIQPAEGGMLMNSRHTISPSRDRWADQPLEPPPHPSELDPAASAPSWRGKLAPLTTTARTSLGKLVPLAAVQPWLSKLAPLTTVRPSLTSVWSSLTRLWSSVAELTPVTFARYLIAFFVGVVAAVAWQSYHSGKNEDNAVATSAALYSVRQSVDNLAAEITKIRAVEQDILGKISAPPPPVAAPARNPAQRPTSVR
jgi:hypothetical protein